MQSQFAKTTLLFLALVALPWVSQAQQPRQIKVSEFNVTDARTLEERVFILHTVLNQGYYCYKSETLPQVVEVYVNSEADDELSDFDFFYDHTLYELRNEFSLYSKEERGILFVEWRQEIDDELYAMLYEDFTKGVASDNSTCETAFPFCTDNGLYQFPAGVDSGSPCGPTTSSPCSDPYACTGTPGQSSNCLSTAPNPAFYYMRIDEPGDLNIFMHSTPQVDIDFDCWGPFSDITTACDALACSNIVDCGYSTSANEYCHINNAQHGQYYILLITNYSNDPCNISFENIGTGTTDCDILPPLVANDGPYCEGETIHLTANGLPGASYSWTGPNGFISNEQNPIIPNCTLAMAGDYVCTITVGSQTNNATTVVEVYQQAVPSFTATEVCQGELTQFNGISGGPNVANYDWDFGDGQTGSGQDVSHLYAQAGNYQVTLTVTAEDGSCPGEITQTVIVYVMPEPTASANPTVVIYDGTSTLTGNAGAPGSFIYHWEPANMVTNPDSPTTQTVPLQASQVYTLTVTNTEGGCTSTIQVIVNMEGSNLTATAYAEQNQLCEDESTTLHAVPMGGTGNYTFSWNGPNGFNSTQQNPVVMPPVGTSTYTCLVGDGIVMQETSVSITVFAKDETDFQETACDYYIWDPQGHTYTEYGHQGISYDASGLYQRTYTNLNGCDSTVRLNLTVNYQHLDAHESYTSKCDAIPFQWFDSIYYLEENGTYPFFKEGGTAHGCDSAILVTVENMHYSPQPSNIQCTDENAVVFGPNFDTIAVVTNTEFFSFQYHFKVYETVHPESEWQTCVWTISKPSWNISFDSIPTKNEYGLYESYCTVFVADRDDHIVVLTATTNNDCDSQTKQFYLKSSFLDIDEHDEAEANVSIAPNPNNGMMRIQFENMEGRTAVRVFDMTGNQIDAFETYDNASLYNYDYAMKPNAQGIYYFIFSNDNRLITRKVVIIY